MAQFKHKDRYYSADGVTAVKQINERDVEVRYGDRKPALLLTDTTSSQVLASIEVAKADADSA